MPHFHTGISEEPKNTTSYSSVQATLSSKGNIPFIVQHIRPFHSAPQWVASHFRHPHITLSCNPPTILTANHHLDSRALMTMSPRGCHACPTSVPQPVNRGSLFARPSWRPRDAISAAATHSLLSAHTLTTLVHFTICPKKMPLCIKRNLNTTRTRKIYV